jgi:hypothetical protein
MLLASLAFFCIAYINRKPNSCAMSFVFLSILQLVVNLFHQMLLHWQIYSKMTRWYRKDRQGSFGATIRSSHQNHPLVLANLFFKFLRILSNMVGSSSGLSGQIFILLIFIDNNWRTFLQV